MDFFQGSLNFHNFKKPFEISIFFILLIKFYDTKYFKLDRNFFEYLYINIYLKL